MPVDRIRRVDPAGVIGLVAETGRAERIDAGARAGADVIDLGGRNGAAGFIEERGRCGHECLRII